jgi:hypothetical protein
MDLTLDSIVYNLTLDNFDIAAHMENQNNVSFDLEPYFNFVIV